MQEIGWFTASAQELARGIRAVKGAMAKEESRPILAAVLIEFNENAIHCVAADNYRLFSQSIYQTEAEGWPQVVVPRHSIGVIEKVLASLKHLPVRVVAMDEDGVPFIKIACQGEVALTVRCVEGQYPNYREIINKNQSAEPLVAVDAGLFNGMPDGVVRLYAGGRLDPLQLVGKSAGFEAFIMPVRID